MADQPNPQPGEFWSTSKGRTVEILASQEVTCDESCGFEGIGVIAYQFLGGSQIHLRAVHYLHGWSKAVFE